MVKLSIPTVLKEKYIGQGMFGVEPLQMDGREAVSQQWNAAVGEGRMLGLINDGVYGSDYCDGEMRTSLIRGAGYTAHPIGDRVIMPQDRFSPRIDQGERLYRFVLEGGDADARMSNLTREAQAVNEPPYALSFFPDGETKTVEHRPAATLEGEGVQMSALRLSQDGGAWIVRLFECAGKDATAHLELPLCGAKTDVTLKPFEIVTLRVDRGTGAVETANLLA